MNNNNKVIFMNEKYVHPIQFWTCPDFDIKRIVGTNKAYSI